MPLVPLLPSDQQRSNFTSFEQQEARKLELAMKSQGLPDGFSQNWIHIERDKSNHRVFITNYEGQMCMLNYGRLEIYYCCPKCRQMGFKNTIVHSSRCDEIIW